MYPLQGFRLLKVESLHPHYKEFSYSTPGTSLDHLSGEGSPVASLVKKAEVFDSDSQFEAQLWQQVLYQDRGGCSVWLEVWKEKRAFFPEYMYPYHRSMENMYLYLVYF